MTTSWTGITTLDGWRAKLQELLEAGRLASESNDDKARLGVCDDLMLFVEKSSPTIEGTGALDDLALEAVQKLSTDIVADAVGRIRARTADIVAISKSVERAAADAENAAAANRLTAARAAIDTLSQTLAAVGTLRDKLTDDSDDGLREAMTALIASVEKAQTLIRKKA